MTKKPRLRLIFYVPRWAAPSENQPHTLKSAVVLGANFLENLVLKNRKCGPAPKPLAELRIVAVTTKFTASEVGQLDQKRGHYGRAAWLRAAGLDMVLVAPLPTEWQTTWQESARIAACLTQINNLASRINVTLLADGEAATVRLLLSELTETREILAEFRASISA